MICAACYSERVIFGPRQAVAAALAKTGFGQQINTAFIERWRLNVRQHLAALGRKVRGLAKTNAGLNDQLTLGLAYCNFILPP